MFKTTESPEAIKFLVVDGDNTCSPFSKVLHGLGIVWCDVMFWVHLLIGLFLLFGEKREKENQTP